MLLGVSIASILVVSVVAYVRSRDALADTVTAQLTSERETLGQRIEAHLDTVAGHAASLAENRMVVEALLEFDVGWSQLADRTLAPPERAALLDVQQDLLDDLPTRADNVDAEQLLPDEAAGRWLQHRYVVTGGASSDGGAEDEATFYERSHERFDPVLRSFTERFGFYDLFLVDTDGRVVYSVAKELDFATSLREGPFSESNLARLVDDVLADPLATEASFTDHRGRHVLSCGLLEPRLDHRRRAVAFALDLRADVERRAARQGLADLFEVVPEPELEVDGLLVRPHRLVGPVDVDRVEDDAPLHETVLPDLDLVGEP